MKADCAGPGTKSSASLLVPARVREEESGESAAIHAGFILLMQKGGSVFLFLSFFLLSFSRLAFALGIVDLAS